VILAAFLTKRGGTWLSGSHWFELFFVQQNSVVVVIKSSVFIKQQFAGSLKNCFSLPDNQ